MWTVAASPIFVATNVMNMTGLMASILLNKDILSIHQDPLGAAGDRRGFTADPGCGAGMCQIWSRPLANGDVFAVLYNRDTAAHGITLDFSLLGPGWAGKAAAFYDVWEHAAVPGTHTGSYAAQVAGHGVVALRATLQA